MDKNVNGQSLASHICSNYACHFNLFFLKLCSMQNFTITALLKIIGNHLSPRMDRYGGTFIVVPLPGMENVL